MKAKEIFELSSQLDQKSRLAILNLIDIKAESDMKEMKAQFKALDTTFRAFESKLDLKLSSLESKIDHVEAKLESKISTMFWVVAVAGAAITAVISIVGLRH